MADEIINVDKKTVNIIKTNNSRKALELNTMDADQVENNLKQLNKIAETIKSTLIDSVDYGQIPGTQKPTLFKAGAEKIVLLFGLKQEYKILEKEINKDATIPYIKYTFYCRLLNHKGIQIAEGYGLCSTQEKAKQDDNPFFIENTVMKVAKKRSLVDAAVSLGILSGIFTQDIDDIDNPLSTKNTKLSKLEMLSLYQISYTHFHSFQKIIKKDFPQDYKEKFKDFIKDFILEIWIKKMKIEAISFQSFRKPDQKIFLDYINDIKNKEKDIAEAMKHYENWKA